MLKLIKHSRARLGLINSVGVMVAYDTADSVGKVLKQHPAYEPIYIALMIIDGEVWQRNHAQFICTIQ